LPVMQYTGLLCGISSGFLVALSTLFTWELTVYEDISYGVVLIVRAVLGCIAIVIYNITDLKRLLGPPEARFTLFIAFLFSAIGNLLFIICVSSLTSFSLGTALSSTQSLWAALLSYYYLKDKLSAVVWIGAVLVFLSYVVIVIYYDSYSSETCEGIIFGFVASFFYGADAVVVRNASLKNTTDDVSSFYLLLAWLIVGAIYSIFDYNLVLSQTVLLEFFGTAITASIALWLLVVTVRLENAPIATLLVSSTTVFSVVLQYVFLGIYLETNEIIEIILIFLGVGIVNVARVMEIRKESRDAFLEEEQSQTELSRSGPV